MHSYFSIRNEVIVRLRDISDTQKNQIVSFGEITKTYLYFSYQGVKDKEKTSHCPSICYRRTPTPRTLHSALITFTCVAGEGEVTPGKGCVRLAQVRGHGKVLGQMSFFFLCLKMKL